MLDGTAVVWRDPVVARAVPGHPIVPQPLLREDAAALA